MDESILHITTTDLLTAATATTSSFPSRFSYAKLTQLQVNGARERAQRQLEKAAWERQWQTVQEQWKRAVEEVLHPQSQQEQLQATSSSSKRTTSRHAVQNALGSVEVSPLLLDRLAALLEREYQARVLDHALQHLETTERRDMVNWMYQQLQSAEDAKLQAQRDQQRHLQRMELEQQTVRLEYLQQRQHMLQTKLQLLWQRHEFQMERLRERETKEQMVVKRPVVVVSRRMGNAANGTTSNSGGTSMPSSSTKWLEEMLDENYFPSSAVASSSSSSSSSSTKSKVSFQDNDDNHDDQGDGATPSTDWVVCGYK
mmetsp:Transcript_12642/g.23627  ORF Transcript_12642/g.23627 Transcript_12642/m.23627 type:complete len:314 (+) Transcript_12642:201-1142(+)